MRPKLHQAWIEGKCAKMAERGKVYRFDAILLGSPAPGTMLNVKVLFGAAAEPQIGSEYADVMPAMGETAGEGADLENSAAALLKRVIGLNCLQYSHASQAAPGVAGLGADTS